MIKLKNEITKWTKRSHLMWWAMGRSDAKICTQNASRRQPEGIQKTSGPEGKTTDLLETSVNSDLGHPTRHMP